MFVYKRGKLWVDAFPLQQLLYHCFESPVATPAETHIATVAAQNTPGILHG